MIHSGLLYQLDISTCYFYEPFLFQIFFPWKFLLHLISTTFTANSQADNHFSKYIYLFQILYSMKSLFIKIHVKVFYIQVQFKCKIPPFWHGHDLQKKLFLEKKIFFL